MMDADAKVAEGDALLARVTRVRIDAEGPTTASVQGALDRGFQVIFGGILEAAIADQRALDAGSPPVGSSAHVFTRESRFVEEQIGSRIDRDGGVDFEGRRVVAFDLAFEPGPGAGFDPSSTLGRLVTGTLLMDDDARLRRLELDAGVEHVVASRGASGVWTVQVTLADAGTPPRVFEGGSLAQALDVAERTILATADGFLASFTGPLEG